MFYEILTKLLTFFISTMTIFLPNEILESPGPLAGQILLNHNVSIYTIVTHLKKVILLRHSGHQSSLEVASLR